MSINVGSAVGYLMLDTTGFKKGFSSAWSDLQVFKDETKTIGDKFSALSSAMTTVGTSLTKNVTMPIIGAGALASKFSIDFESAFAGVKKTVDATDKEFAMLEEGIRGMSKELPASAVEIAAVAEAAGQLGIEVPNIMGFTRTMIDLGEATNLSADEAATALARLANITGMPQTEFDRLGSTVVALGNNLATTEAEIVEMGLRLAGAGSQVGMTEAEILSFAGALSSIGIQAQAGGSAFSKVMVEMQLATETNSEALNQFADVAGMSADEFKTAFQEDAAGAIIAFIQGLGSMEERGISAIKVLDDMDIKEETLRRALLGAAGASDVFTDAIELGSQAWEENTALTNEASQRYGTSASKLEIMKNKLVDVGISLGDIVVPVFMEFMGYIEKGIEWFGKLNPATQEMIVKIAALAAALGPAAIIGGKVAGGISSIIGLFGKFAPAAGLAAKAVTAVSTPTWALGGAMKAGALLMNPWTIGLVAAGTAAYAVSKNLSEDAIPAVNLFNDEISEGTQEAVGSFMKLNDEVSIQLKQLAWSGQTITQEMADEMIAKYGEMNGQILGAMQERHNEQIALTQDFFARSEVLSAEEEAAALARLQKNQEAEQLRVKEGQDKIAEILQKASDEKRELTDVERIQINMIQKEMTETAIKVLSDSEVEQLAIMESLRSQAGEISARQAAEVVQNSKKQTDEVIKNANEQYVRSIAEIEYLRDEAGVISFEQAQEMIAEAERTRDETVNNAKLMHDDVVKEAKLQAGEHVNEVDWETGEVLSRWDIMKRDIPEKAKELKEATVLKVKEIKEEVVKWYTETKDDVITKVEEMKKEVVEKWENLRDDTITWGKNLVEGLWNGMTEKAQWLKDKISGFIEGIKEKFTDKDGFDMHSPSEVMKIYGKYINEGLALGIEENKSKPEEAMNNLVNVIGNSLGKVNNFVKNSVNVIEKEFTLWKLMNEELAGSSEELAKKLDVQRQKSEYLTEQIKVTEEALRDIILAYGDTSDEALKLKNTLLDLQIEQANLTNEVKQTTQAYNGLVDAALAARIKAYDEKRDSGGGTGSSYRKSRENYYSVYKDEIDAISRERGVDLGVAQEIHRNEITVNITASEPLDAQGVVRETKKAIKNLLEG